MSTFQFVRHAVAANGVATLTMDRPSVHNAFDDQMISELLVALTELQNDEAVRVLVLESTGKNFSAGADLAWMRSMATKNYDENLADAGNLAELMHKLDTFKAPTIAKVQGAAFGGAVGLVACCDMAVAIEKTSFCLSEVKIGLIPAVISPYVVRAIGERASRRYFLTAERFFALEAKALGLLSHVVAEEELDVTVTNVINTLLQNSPQALNAAKQLIRDVANQPTTPELIAHTSRQIAAIRVSKEGQEGLSAFLEKRTAAWIVATQPSEGQA